MLRDGKRVAADGDAGQREKTVRTLFPLTTELGKPARQSL